MAEYFLTTDSSQTVINCLLNEANKYGVEILMNTEVQRPSALQQSVRNNLRYIPKIDCRLLCALLQVDIAKATMFEWLKSTGHQIEAPLPSLFTFNLPGHPICNMMGLSVANVKIKIAGTKLEQKGPVLITHWGISGPAVIKLSAWGAKELADKAI
jgi:predicted flavoprotein YhiN